MGRNVQPHILLQYVLFDLKEFDRKCRDKDSTLCEAEMDGFTDINGTHLTGTEYE
jgi:hypothetical protein